MKTRRIALVAIWISAASIGLIWAEDSKDRPLTLVRQIRPTYPEAARKEALAGAVQLETRMDRLSR